MEDIDNLEKQGNDMMNYINKAPNFLAHLTGGDGAHDNRSGSGSPTSHNNNQNNIHELNSKSGMSHTNSNNTHTKESHTVKSKPKPHSNEPTNFHTNRVDKLLRKYNNDYIQSLKATDTVLKNKGNINQEYEKYTKELNRVKSVNRDEDLLKMQKQNQDIEHTLGKLKNKDKTELVVKEEESKKLVEELNNLFLDKKKEALEKDQERKDAIEEIKKIKIQQQDLEKRNKESRIQLSELEKEVENLDRQVKNYEEYKKFIDEVIENSNESGSNNNYDYDKLKDQFENLIERMNEIKEDIAKQEAFIKKKKKEQSELMKKNDKQAQNQKLLQLEEEAKILAKENKDIEKEIEDIMNKNQKKESDNHQIMLSIINLYGKVTKKQDMQVDTENIKEHQLCKMLDTINEKMNDLIQIYNALENKEKDKDK